MATKDIINVASAAQGIALVGSNLQVVKKKKIKTKDMIKLGTTNIVGTSLIKAQADIAATL